MGIRGPRMECHSGIKAVGQLVRNHHIKKQWIRFPDQQEHNEDPEQSKQELITRKEVSDARKDLNAYNNGNPNKITGEEADALLDTINEWHVQNENNWCASCPCEWLSKKRRRLVKDGPSYQFSDNVARRLAAIPISTSGPAPKIAEPQVEFESVQTETNLPLAAGIYAAGCFVACVLLRTLSRSPEKKEDDC